MQKPIAILMLAMVTMTASAGSMGPLFTDGEYAGSAGHLILSGTSNNFLTKTSILFYHAGNCMTEYPDSYSQTDGEKQEWQARESPGWNINGTAVANDASIAGLDSGEIAAITGIKIYAAELTPWTEGGTPETACYTVSGCGTGTCSGTDTDTKTLFGPQ
ncbi:MAG: hypothetical protein P1U40_00805 [Coxiellaceae bacterium]|nr:hypothetical protein [Coxiellaceae bacterium]